MRPNLWCILLTFVTLYPCTVNLECLNNRKVYTERTGYITDSLHNYYNNKRCEWLIKGNVGDTVTITIYSAHLEEGFDFLFIHDGGSRSSKLLGRLNGRHGKTELISSSNMVYLLMFSDKLETREGFNISYTIDKCPGNCSNKGTCEANGLCNCVGRQYGMACTYEWCPELCYQGERNISKCNVTVKKCVCGSDFYGEDCSISQLSNTGVDSWYLVSQGYQESFPPRYAHISGYIQDGLLVHGGQNLNEVLDDVWLFDFKMNKWEELKTNKTKPTGRFLHASVVYEDSMILFGGELNNNLLSNELWLFNLTTKSWLLLSNDPAIPALSGHSMTLAGKNIYIIGGKVMNGYFSKKIYCYHLEDDTWETIPSPTLGKTVQLGLFGHSACYHEKSHTIVVYGGFYLCSIHMSIDRTSNSIWIYNIEKNSWSELRSTESSPPSLVFHSAVMVEDYMIIQGGYIHHDQPKEMSNGTYYYNLHCHTWVNENRLSKSNQPTLFTSRFSHKAVLKDLQTIIIVGGYNRLQALGDVLAYKLPEAIVTIPINPGGHCKNYKTEDSCVNDPSCSFCKRVPEHCFSSYDPNACAIGPKSAKCPKMCLQFLSCESCTINDGCQWCPLTSKCSHVNDTNSCSTSYEGWWGSNQMEFLTHLNICQEFTKQPGLTFFQYLNTNSNPDYPDHVEILHSFEVYKLSVPGSRISVQGFIYPYLHHTDISLATCMKLYARLLDVSVNISKYNGIMEQDQVGMLKSSENKILETALECKNERLFPVKNANADIKNLSYYISIYGDILYLQDKFIYLDLRWNQKGNDNMEDISQSYLQAYYTKNCSNHLSCGSCVGDSSCGWCPLKQECLSASSWKQCKYGNTSVYLTRTFPECLTCIDYYECHSCEEDKFCGWTDKGCQQKKDNKLTECPTSCYSFNNTESCIQSARCIWCTEKDLCIPISQYSTHNKYGQCGAFRIEPGETSADCGKYTYCEDCLLNYPCGWCFDEYDPRNGRCTSGDFMSPHKNCSLVFEHDMVRFNYSDSLLWAYDRCPDLDECNLKLDSCPNNSECVNTYGSYKCVCNQGFKDDGNNKCVKTCWPECVHGKCNSEYKCDCDLGWRGENCSVDCGCHGHSTCVNQTGVCDKCQDYTFGRYCEFCVNGSYGNATTEKGCWPCSCNGHGDPLKNQCDPLTGHCFCLNFTSGTNCSECKYPYVGDPKLGACYLPCQRSSIINNQTSGYLRPTNDDLDAYARCLWVISAENTSLNNVMYRQRRESTENVLLTIHQLNISCSNSWLNIYDGVPPNPRTKNAFLSSPFQLLGKLCGAGGIGKQFISSTGILSVFYEGVSSSYSFSRSTPSPGFFAEFALLRCPDHCLSPFICKVTPQGENCTCRDGWFGDSCQYEECPNNCSQTKGVCNLETKKCECVAGFAGTDCSKIQDSYFVMKRRDARFLGVKPTDLPHYGSTMFEYDSSLYVYGGINIVKDSAISMLEFNLKTNEWTTSSFDEEANVTNRYHHCSFVYKNFFYIYGGYIQDDGKAQNGGKTQFSATNELFELDLLSKSWHKKSNSHSLPKIVAHTCTVIGSMVYIIGGFIPDDGLNEYVTTIDLTTHDFTISNLKFSGLEPTGLYSHVAVYDETSGKIFVHGGMAFYHERVQQSNRVYVLDPNTPSWHHVESLPDDPLPTLIGHVAQVINHTVYILGGYSDELGHNKDVFVWRLTCNKWTRLSGEANTFRVGDGESDRQFSASVLVNNSIYIFSGYNTQLSGELTQFIPDLSYPTISSPNCTVQVAKERECSSYSSCTSCHSTHPQGRARCTWCRCASSFCIPLGESCPCNNGHATSIHLCEETVCETSTCKNCGGSRCMWSRSFLYHNELKRHYSADKEHPYNCFRESLAALAKQDRNAVAEKCPLPCHMHSSCSACLSPNVHGDLAGSEHCFWSEKLSSCLSYALLPLACSFGRCGQLYNPAMIGKCPKRCSQNRRCSTCFEDNACGWCGIDEKGAGSCMAGEYQGTLQSTDTLESSCGLSAADINEPIVISNSSTNFTWAFALCPLENECLNGHHTCQLHERCQDLPQGFSCLCKPGFNKSMDGSCEPVCNQGCVNGRCVAPDQCNCSFSWTSPNCSVPCQCNGHSNCLLDDPAVCLKCQNNTKGASCELCQPLYVGDPRNGSNCKSCLETCNNNAELCMSVAQYSNLTDDVINNRTLLLQYLDIGLSSTEQAFCANCTGFSEGDRCEICKKGYFQYEQHGCHKCMCNGHAFTCNRTTGEGCECKQNTRSDAACKTKCYSKQCTKCVGDFFGDPSDGQQCYSKIQKEQATVVTVQPFQTQFHYTAPDYTNVDIRLVIDVLDGVVDIYIDDSSTSFKVEVNESTNTHTLVPLHERVRRSTEEFPTTVTASQHDLLTYAEYMGNVLTIKNVRKRLVVAIRHATHNLSKKWFYIGVASDTSTESSLKIYYQQDLPRIDLMLFFLVLLVILLLILTGFILGWKIRHDWTRRVIAVQLQKEIETMANRPLATYQLRLEQNGSETKRNGSEGILRNAKLKSSGDKEKKSPKKLSQDSLRKKPPSQDGLLPLAIQNTSDNLASIYTVMLQYPENELSQWNLTLGSCLAFSQNQQLLFVKTTYNGLQGAKFDTRISSTAV